jgi:isoleucyl-tRNA synthetase
LDRWILDEFSTLEQQALEAYDRYEFHAVYQKLSQFVAVELSAIYHDAVKDRLYTDPADSARRRSTQTALHRIVVALCKMLNPILSFTADEAWEFVPGKTADYAQLLTWQPMGFVRNSQERATWKSLFELRQQALPVLEKARQAKEIGKALEAKLTFAGQNQALAAAAQNLEALRELLNVSQVQIQSGPSEELVILVTKADGQKCERCWHWETDIGSSVDHPTICARCVRAITQVQEA